MNLTDFDTSKFKLGSLCKRGLVTYDSKADAIYIYLKDSKVVGSETISPSVAVDYDKDGDIVGVEILSFLSKLSQAKPIKKEDIGTWLRSLAD
jgi:uncharacterized protein YuzE